LTRSLHELALFSSTVVLGLRDPAISRTVYCTYHIKASSEWTGARDDSGRNNFLVHVAGRMVGWSAWMWLSGTVMSAKAINWPQQIGRRNTAQTSKPTMISKSVR